MTTIEGLGNVMRICLPSGLDLYPTGTRLAVAVPAGSVVTCPTWWSRLDCLTACAKLGLGQVCWADDNSGEVA